MSEARNRRVARGLLLALTLLLAVGVGLLGQIAPPGGFDGLELATD